MIPLLIIFAAVGFGIVVSLVTSQHVVRELMAHSRSGRNGFRWVMLTGDVIDEVLRLLQYVCLVLLLGPLIAVPPTVAWSWRSWLFLTIIVCIVLASINRWTTTRGLIRALKDHDRPQGESHGH